jgi:hypothetical protein
MVPVLLLATTLSLIIALEGVKTKATFEAQVGVIVTPNEILTG